MAFEPADLLGRACQGTRVAHRLGAGGCPAGWRNRGGGVAAVGRARKGVGQGPRARADDFVTTLTAYHGEEGML